MLATPTGAELYGKRTAMIEPDFADTKFNRNIEALPTPSPRPVSTSPGSRSSSPQGTLTHLGWKARPPESGS
jgi:hypothetical protein